MGRKLIIKGADFSANGIEVIAKRYTSLVDKNGDVVEVGTTLAKEITAYFYYRTDVNVLARGASYPTSIACSSTLNDLIEVEEYTHAKITSTTTLQMLISNPKWISPIMLFLDENKKLLGGFSSEPEDTSLENVPNVEFVGKSNDERTFEMDIPSGAKYVVCNALSLNRFILELSKND